MSNWIYLHIINTSWFILFGISMPGLFGLFIIYKLYMLSKEQGNQSNQDNQENEGYQSNKDDGAVSEQ
ncbi:hypothetical protein M3226_02995 [Neobacillus cucumis]|uniref:hypothetical protein n=1 Tax=Neobacillus cucumis TaxID=1740721 RepID=UPI00203AFFCB|nr:hypothetical protein [Neobacillus cucumis]MCM3724663.1 hypothetical protein [Neobacillus cucumis]